ncbi:MAG: hypothetical protein UR28_C0012G0028 [Candidatus Peregrinibacteria bacterium GW2011_GWF2_33_10]|nr:MAG: hypothetical protein UR28_C0012G0028 [Candidatus Peregrinibacteria bacterium GW2011_GWF2_33_10]OGJ44068.1 MAG: hypothetical protein A2263_01540 [Candidatus Peregrinibacteria bacterium RIFOXYA2_FULL_33_21]OGJ45713.1 MAG: hypothetical protein A2272_03835 [Candidatus Peregrinibacteria bacterium RIFOXYA12_FULL_33_12]OGJ51407.1 MAG: hypothetical protein A2307_02565 [Candidatus Peregrinibacteria bacterium RIFOXYB2_FULL_33_20]
MITDEAILSAIPAVKFRQNLGEFLNRVNLQGEYFVVERDGKPLAAMVSIYDFARIQGLAKKDMKNLFDTWTQRKKVYNKDEDIENLVVEEVRAVRKNSKIK